MAWRTEMVELLRVMVRDLDPATYRFPDSSLERTIVVAARMVATRLPFPIRYDADVANRDILPDPTEGESRNDNFTNLVSLKAAAIIDMGDARAESGIVIRDNGSMVDLHYKLEAAVRLVQGKGGWAAQYDDAELKYLSDQGMSGVAGALVLAPFREWCREHRLSCREDAFSRTYRIP